MHAPSQKREPNTQSAGGEIRSSESALPERKPCTWAQLQNIKKLLPSDRARRSRTAQRSHRKGFVSSRNITWEKQAQSVGLPFFKLSLSSHHAD